MDKNPKNPVDNDLILRKFISNKTLNKQQKDL